MKTPHEPLTPEERALAQSLSRLGPHGAPSPDLDARILGAARAAVQDTPSRGGAVPPTRRRWPLGMGVAASVLLAAGIAWQLRPSHDIPVASEAPAQTQRSANLMGEDADAVAADAAAPAAPPPSPPLATVATEPALPAKAMQPPSPSATLERDATPSGPARKNAEAAARQETVPKRSPLALIPAVPGLPSAEETSPREQPAAPHAFPAEMDAYAPPAAMTADVPEAIAGAQTQHRAAAQQQEDQRIRYEEERKQQAAANESRTLDTISVTGSRARTRERQPRAQDVAPAATAAAPPPPPAPAASAGSVQPSAARTALRRTDLQLPVDADTRLPPEEWLDRIRLRRDLGDNANALRSLQLFVQEHPFQRVPDDLRPLLGTP
nr:hypothetical protein [uncultured Pseudoxanthomonas sp.]